MKDKKSIPLQLVLYFIIFALSILICQSSIRFFMIYPKINEAKNKLNINNTIALKGIIEKDRKKIESILQVHSTWDSFYKVIYENKEKIELFTDEHFNQICLERFKLDYVAIYNREKELLWRGINKNIEYDNIKFEELLNTSIDIVNMNNEKVFLHNINGENFFIALSPIVAHENSKDYNGFLMFLKKIDYEFIKFLEYKNNSKIRYINLSKEKENKISKFNFIKNTNKNNIFYENAFGEKIIRLDISFGDKINVRDLYPLREDIYNILICLIMTFLLYFFSKKKISKPIIQLDNLIENHFGLLVNKKNKFMSGTSEINSLYNSYIELITNIQVKNKEINELNKKLRKLSCIDSLTGLYHRRKFQEIVVNISDFYENKKISIILCDIDCFKLYNDTYGHIAGDIAIKKVSSILKESVDEEQNEYAFRYGGEEFLILLENYTHKKTEEKIRNIQSKIKKLNIEHSKSEVSDSITLSFGFSCTNSFKLEKLDSFLQCVDDALYLSKNNGRNNYTYIEFQNKTRGGKSV